MDTNKTPLQYARTESGRVDTEAYVGLDGVIKANSLEVNVKITGARIRYGHLDLQVTPKDGAGAVWIERKNISIPKDPVAHFHSTKVATSYGNAAEASGFSSDVKQMIRKMIQEQTATVSN